MRPFGEKHSHELGNVPGFLVYCRYMKSREFFNADNTPEDPELQKEREREAGEKIAREEKIPEMEAWLDQVDFDVLEDMFEEDIRKTAISPEKVNVLRRDRMRNMNGNIIGGYIVPTNEILLGYKKIKIIAKYAGIDAYLEFLETLIHEENHAVSKTRCWNLQGESGAPVLSQSGYAKTGFDDKKEPGFFERAGKVFELFNEGVTEKRARKMFREYLRRTGRGDADKVKRFEQYIDINHPYNRATQVTEALTRRLAAANGITEEAAEGAIMRGYYEGEDLLRKDFQEWFQEMLPPGFIDKLRVADDNDMKVLLKELEQMPFKKAA